MIGHWGLMTSQQMRRLNEQSLLRAQDDAERSSVLYTVTDGVAQIMLNRSQELNASASTHRPANVIIHSAPDEPPSEHAGEAAPESPSMGTPEQE